MHAVNIKEAKARLNELVDAAVRGDQVVLMRGSKHVAAIVPITADDLELSARISDEQAARLWKQLHQEHSVGRSKTFATADEAVAFLRAGDRVTRRKRAR